MTIQLTAVGLAVAAAVCIDIGLVLLKVRGDRIADRVGRRMPDLMAGYATDALWLTGLLLQPFGYGLYLWALGFASLNIVQTAMSSGVVIFVLFAVCAWGERLTRLEWVAVATVVLGMVLLGVSIVPDLGDSHAAMDVRAVLSLSVIVPGFAVMAWLGVAPPGKQQRKGLGLALASGLLLGLASIYAKGLALAIEDAAPGQGLLRAVTTPYAPLTLITNLVGFVLLLMAFRAARASIALALSATLSNVVPILAGMLVLGERLPAHRWLAGSRLVAFLLTLGGAALLVHRHPSATPR